MSPYRHDETVESIVQILTTGFIDYRDAFATITQRAVRRFERCDWLGMRRDTLERLDLYAKVATETAGLINRLVNVETNHPERWKSVKSGYFDQIAKRCDAELACTFLNSVSRKLFGTVGFDPRLAFTHSPEAEDSPSQMASLVYTQVEDRISDDTIQMLLTRYGFRVPFKHIREDAALCAARLHQLIDAATEPTGPVRIEMIKAPFFRGMSAYLVGRLTRGGWQMPLVFAIDNSRRGLCVDALLSRPEEIRILFSFSRAYFHVNCDCPSALVCFLKGMMPRKRVAEIYIGLGFHKHGKTELYRDLLDHQKVCGQDRFDFAPGKRGMVMVAFNMPRDELIYKLIRDRFDSPKRTSAKLVMDKYDYVFKHDRVGRLVDVQTFENLELEVCCFTPDLLSAIDRQARTAATVGGDHVIFHHAYVERRVIPLDVYFQEVTGQAAESAVIDYGQAIKDLAQVNVFPGDLLIKNFGVTNLGRVVFYDYDELCRLTDCRFRKLPQSRQYEDELDAEPWFMVADNDVFPEEFASFLGFPPDMHQVFMRHHDDLLQPEFWIETQKQIRAGAWRHIRPYGQSPRLHPHRSPLETVDKGNSSVTIRATTGDRP